MIPSKIKIECFAKRCHMATLGGKGLRRVIVLLASFHSLNPVTTLAEIGEQDRGEGVPQFNPLTPRRTLVAPFTKISNLF